MNNRTSSTRETNNMSNWETQIWVYPPINIFIISFYYSQNSGTWNVHGRCVHTTIPEYFTSRTEIFNVTNIYSTPGSNDPCRSPRKQVLGRPARIICFAEPDMQASLEWSVPFRSEYRPFRSGTNQNDGRRALLSSVLNNPSSEVAAVGRGKGRNLVRSAWRETCVLLAPRVSCEILEALKKFRLSDGEKEN